MKIVLLRFSNKVEGAVFNVIISWVDARFFMLKVKFIVYLNLNIIVNYFKVELILRCKFYVLKLKNVVFFKLI